jgi:mycothiol synthase
MAITDRLRVPTLADIPAVTALLIATDLAELGEPDTSEDEVRHGWSLGDPDPAHDMVVLEDAAGTLIGHVAVHARREHEDYDATVHLHPEHADDARFDALITWALARVRARAGRAAATLGVYRTGGHAAKEAALERHGFPCVRLIHRMRIDLPAVAPAEPPPPPGLRVAALRPGEDDAAFHAVMQDAFADHFRHAHLSLEQWRGEMLGDPVFRPELFLTLWDDETMVGAIECFDAGDLAFVPHLGVRTSHQRRGLGALLLRTLFARVHARGQRRLELGVDTGNTRGAVALYERLGMRVTQRYALHLRAVGPA